MDNTKIVSYAKEVEAYLKTHPYAVTDLVCEKEELPAYKEVFHSMLNESMYRRVNFIPQRQ